MQTLTTARVRGAIDALETGARQLALVDAPTSPAGGLDATRAAHLVRAARTDAETAVELLQSSGVTRDAIDQLQAAVRLLGHDAVDEAGFRDIGRRVTEHVSHVRADRSVREAIARDAAAHALLERPLDTYGRDEWRQLGRFLDAGTTRELDDLPRALPGMPELRPIVDDLASGRDASIATVQSYVDRWLVRGKPTRVQEDVVVRLLERHPADLSRADWRRLHLVLRHADDSAVLALARRLPGAAPLDQLVDDLARGVRTADASIERYFTAAQDPAFNQWRSRHDPAYPHQLANAVDEAARGAAGPASRSILTHELDRLAELTAERTPQERTRIAMTILDDDGIASSRTVRSTLELLRDALHAPSDLPAPLANLHRETRRLVDRNLARLDLTMRERSASGHPDYAEIGRLRANLALLDGARGLGEPTVAPAVAADTQTLTW